MEVHLIVALAKNNYAIGKNNDLLWHLPKDMHYFKQTTNGYPVITGRKNYLSIPEKFRPLPNRLNIILTRNTSYQAPGAEVVNTLEAALEVAKNTQADKCFIIGGGEIYHLALTSDLVDVMHITFVDGDFEADTFFPRFNEAEWDQEVEEYFNADAKNKYDFTIVRYQKKNK